MGKHIKKIQTNEMMNAIVSSLIPGLTELFEHEFFFPVKLRFSVWKQTSN